LKGVGYTENREMMKNIFSNVGEKFLRDEMNICIDDLTNKIISDASQHQVFFGELIDTMINIKLPNEYSDLGSDQNSENKKYIIQQLSELIEKYNIPKEDTAYHIFDNLCHAFVVFKEFGLCGLYKNSTSEDWYPKVIIRENIGSRDDIDLLSDEIIAYRGTSKDEYDSMKFGQSWTLAREVADDFAFTHYQGKDGYENTERVVLKTTINKDFIYCLYKSDDNDEDAEKELILDERKIFFESVEIIEEKLI
jgi:hypothetical protein